jgi:pyruvate-formate lyase
MGEESEEVLASVTEGSTEEQLSYDEVMQKFEEFFRVRKNVIFERIRFNQRNQAPDESAEEYIMTLYKLAKNCEYGEMKSKMIRDRLVVGIRDLSLSERLQLDPKLTLEAAKKAVR